MTAAELTADRRAALARFYHAHHDQLAACVWRRVRRCDRAAVIADACAYAWLQLVRRADVTLDRRGLNWLTLVATHEAWRLAATRGDLDLQAIKPGTGDVDEFDEHAGTAADPLERVLDLEAHRARAERFTALKPCERRDLFLHAAGFTYADIARLTAATYTAVNRHIAEGRGRLHCT